MRLVPNLKYLLLDDNQLIGVIPPEIGNLTNLIWLQLHNNSLEGWIPEEVCSLIESNNWAGEWNIEEHILEGNDFYNTCE